MSLKRGLARLYVAAWAGWAVIAAVIAGTAIQGTVTELKGSVAKIDKLVREPRPQRSATELGRMAKERWPGAYDDLSDEQLGLAVQRKWSSPYDQLAAVSGAVGMMDTLDASKASGRPDTAMARMVGLDGSVNYFPASASDATMHETLKREARSQSARRVARSVGLWFLSGIFFPGALLVATRWVWAGFEHRPEAKN